MREAQRWTVVLDITPDDGAVRAVARLRDRSATRLVGEGAARMGPVERVAPAVGADVAAARALHQLSERLVAAAKHEYDIAVRRRQSAQRPVSVEDGQGATTARPSSRPERMSS